MGAADLFRRSTWSLAAILLACTPTPPSPPVVAPAPAPTPAAPPAEGLKPRTDATPEWTPVVRELTASPMALTASDGTALKLVKVKARTVVDDPLAFTELELTFDNPQSRRLEGRFEIALPHGAAISRFAMMIGDQWQEGEVVERAKSQRAYEDFLHRGIDPALLEHAGGNRFSARVFPIEPGQTKKLIVAYSQELSSDPVLVPLQGLPAINVVDVQVSAVGASKPAQWLQRTGYAPEGDFGLDRSLRTESAGLQSGDLVLARVRPKLSVGADPVKTALVLVDTSASRAADFEAQRKLVAEVVKGMGQARVVVAAFDQSQEALYDGPAYELDGEALTTLRARGALGASDLASALRWAATVAKDRSLERVVLVGDGVTTAGDAGEAEVDAAVKALGGAGVRRVDAVAVGGIRDDAALGRVVRTLPRVAGQAGVVLDAMKGAEEIGRRLALGVKKVSIQVPGARWFGPHREAWLQPGDEVLVYAELLEKQVPRVSIDGETTRLGGLRTVSRTLLERSWAKARIDGWLDQAAREGSSEAIDQAIVALSTEHRVLAPQTAMVVLEREEDFARWDIDRDALADILSIDEQGRVVAMTRQAPVLAPGAAPRFNRGGSKKETALDERDPGQAQGTDPLSARGNMWGDSIGDSFGAGGLGLSGIGEGGGGRGEGVGLGSIGTAGRGGGSGQGFGSGNGRLGRSRRARPPRVRMGTTNVSGRLPPEVIQRIVRQNFGRFRLCYENGLRNNPNLQGRVVVRFVIGRDGQVYSVSGGGDLPDGGVQSCVTRAFYGLSFPQPEGGS